MSQNSVTILAPAKINLTLDILGKRQDGYHELRSIMQSVSVYDRLTVTETGCGGFSMICGTEGVPCDGRNLVIKAATAFCEKFGIGGGFEFLLEKSIPSMAGMAGGSSDCAAALIALNRLTGTNASLEKLLKIGKGLGADVPFCLAGGSRICEGIGEILTPLQDMPKCHIVIVKPSVSISTPLAFSKYDSISSPQASDFDGMCKAFGCGDLNGIAKRMFNALEYSSACPEIDRAKDELLSYGAIASMMTGSGSAVFGIFDGKTKAEECFIGLKGRYGFCEICHPVSHGCIFEENE